MLDLQQRIVSRWPQWFTGSPGRITRPILRELHRYTRLDQAEGFVADHPHLRGLTFVEGVLRHLDVRYVVDDLERQRIPQQGACVVVANHPLGALDALALLKLVGDIRPDVRIVANDWLMLLEPLRELLLPVRVFGGPSDDGQLNSIDMALAQGCAVLMFPAGEVSRLGWRGVRDRTWRHGFLRYAARHSAPVVPVHIRARHGAAFYAGAAVAGPIGSALLPRQIFPRRERRIECRIGRGLAPAAATDSAGGRRQQAGVVQRAVERLARGQDLLPTRPEAIAHGGHTKTLSAEMARLETLGETPDGKRIVLMPPGQSPPLLRELARLREATFRAVGEGTDAALDWDRYDAWYDQLVLWDDAAQRLVGAYRLARSGDVVATRGLDGLYTASLFTYRPECRPILEAGLELGRSFVVPDYWGTRGLEYLWFGIGAYLRRHPQLRYLFGTVSISAALPPEARDAMVRYYGHHYGCRQMLAQARHPYCGHAQTPADGALTSDQAFRLLKAELARLGARVPTLYKQYTELCEPGGAQFLAFGVDARFNDAVDGLILVDLQRVTPRKRQRYLLQQLGRELCDA